MRIIDRIHRDRTKIAIAIAAAILLIAPIWFAFEISTFSSLSSDAAKSWLRFSELMLIAATILLTLGLVGEWSDSEVWKASLWYKAAKAAVIIGVVGELLGDAGIFSAGDRVESLDNAKIIALETQLAPRKIDGPIFMGLLRSAPKAKVELLYVREDPDSYQLALQIVWYLSGAGWDSGLEKPIPPVTPTSPYAEKPVAMSVVGHATGITLVVHDNADLTGGPLLALFKAFKTTPGQAGRGIDPGLPAGMIRIVVAPKPLPPGTFPADAGPDPSDRVLLR